MKRYGLFIIIFLLLLTSGLIQGCSDKASPTEPTELKGEITTSETAPAAAPLSSRIPDIDVRNVTNLRGNTFHFGDVRADETGYNFIDIYNIGRGDLVISEVRMNPGGVFYITGSDCLSVSGICSPGPVTFPYTLPPGTILHVFLEFRPFAAGGYCSTTDYLKILSNDPDESKVAIYMCGRGIK